MHDGIDDTKNCHYLSDFVSANDWQVKTKLFLHNSIFFNWFKFCDTKYNTAASVTKVFVVAKQKEEEIQDHTPTPDPIEDEENSNNQSENEETSNEETSNEEIN